MDIDNEYQAAPPSPCSPRRSSDELLLFVIVTTCTIIITIGAVILEQ